MKKKHLDITLLAVSALLLTVIGAGVWLLPSSDFSEEENRALATLSQPTSKSIIDGSFTNSLSAYLTDRLPARLEFIRLRAYSELSLFKGECNGVIFCRDGYLLDRGEYADLDKAENSVSEICALCSELSAADIPVSVAYVPRGIDVMKNKLPPLYSGNENKIFELLSQPADSIDLRNYLKYAADTGENVWFKTDHHWTSHGAYAAYVQLSAELGYAPYSKDFFKIETVSENFLGSIYSRAGCIAPSADSIELYRYEGDEEFLLKTDEGVTHNGFYFFEYLEKKDEYAIFLGGNYAYATIEKKTDEPRSRLLIIKDSYANSLVPFLALHFDIEMIDPRFYSGYEEILQKIKNVDRVLIIQGIDTLAT